MFTPQASICDICIIVNSTLLNIAYNQLKDVSNRSAYFYKKIEKKKLKYLMNSLEPNMNFVVKILVNKILDKKNVCNFYLI